MAKEETAEEVEVPKKKGKLLIIILAVVGLIVLAAGGIAVWLLTSTPDKSKPAGEHGEEEQAAEEEGEEVPPIYEKLEQFTVNLADQESYLQTEIQLMLADPEAQAKIKTRMPEVRHSILGILSSKTAEELNQPDGKELLAEEIQKKVNGLLGFKKKNEGVKKVLIVAFIIQ